MPRFQSRWFVVLAAATAVASLSLAVLQGDVPPASQPASQPAQLPATAPAVVDVDQLIKQLGSDDSDQRDAAQKQLADMGKSVSEKLKKAAENDEDPEIRTRASAALAQMKDRDDNQTSLITLHTKDAPAQGVIDAIGTQAHAQFVGLGTVGLAPKVAARTMTIDADSKPFWNVMEDVCTQLSVCPVLEASGQNSMRLFPVARNWIVEAPHQVVGAYWVGMAGIYHMETINLMGPQMIDDLFTIRLIVYPEPKLVVAQMSELNVKEAVDDAGNSLIFTHPAAGGAAVVVANRYRQVTRMIDSRLLYPAQPGKKIKLLRGEVTMLLAQDVQRLEVDDVMGTPKISNPLAHCTVKASVIKSSNGVDLYQATLECTRDGLSDEKWAAMMNRMSDISLQDADNHPLLPLGMFAVTPGTDNTFSGTCLFSRTAFGINEMNRVPKAQPPTKPGEPRKLTWNVPTSLKPVTIPVEFKDLPMP